MLKILISLKASRLKGLPVILLKLKTPNGYAKVVYLYLVAGAIGIPAFNPVTTAFTISG